MRNVLGIAFSCAVALLVCTTAVQAGFGFRVSGGYYRMGYGDYNDFVEVINNSIARLNQQLPPEMRIPDELDALHWVPEFTGEILYGFVPTFEVGLGVGIMYGKSKLSFSFQDESFLYEHRAKAYPIMLTGYWRPPTTTIKPYLFGGLGMYSTTLEFEESVTEGTTREAYTAELSKWGFGLHGGGGISFNVAPMLAIDIEARFRWADIKGFEGTATSSDGEKLDVFLAKGYVDNMYVYGPESVDNKNEWEEGSFNLSGFGLFIALRASF
jgi:opacity protein-like surface antigen